MSKRRPNAIAETSEVPTAERWIHRAQAYAELIRDPNKDSRYLRERGLQPILLEMAGDCSHSRVLDVGCGDGWLLNALSPEEGHGCDLHRHESFPNRWHFTVADVRNLSHPDAYFDLTVASLVLMWFPELSEALAQLCRVTKPDERVIIAIMNPYFYRTGHAHADGHFTVARDLSNPFVIADYKIADAVGPFPYHYRPLPDYLNGCLRAGLAIEQVKDWFIDMDDFIAHFGTERPVGIRRSGKVPLYTFVRCRRV